MDPLFVIFLLLFIPGLLTVILVVAVVLPRAIRDDRARQRLAANRCPHCGHDLRATDGPCPECGQFVSETVQPPSRPASDDQPPS